MQCEQCRQQFGERYDGALSPHQAEAVRRHTDGCADCAAGYAQFVAAVDSVRALEPVSPPARLLADISSGLDATPAPVSPAQRAVRLGPWLAAAACFALIFVGVMKQSNYRVAPVFAPQAEAPVAPRAVPAEPVSPTGTDAESVARTEAEEATVIVAESASGAEEAEEIPAGAGPPEEAEPIGRTGRRAVTPPPVRAERPPPVPSAIEARDETASSVAEAPPARTLAAESAVQPAVVADATGPTLILADRAPLHAARSEGTVKYFDATPTEASAAKVAPPTPTKGEPDKLLVHFIPPRIRRVGLPVTAAVTLSGGAAFPEVTVRVETREGLRLAPAQDECIYRGPLPAGEAKKIEFKLLADRQGTHRMRISVETPVTGLQAQMEVILPDFEAGDETAPTTDALGDRVTVTFNETPLRRALLELARQGGINLVLASTVGNERATYSCIDTPAGSVVRILAETHGYRVTAEDNSYYISKEQ